MPNCLTIVEREREKIFGFTFTFDICFYDYIDTFKHLDGAQNPVAKSYSH